MVSRTPFLPFIEVMRGSFRVSAGEVEQDVTQKLQRGLTALGLHSTRNLGLLLHLLALKVPDGALTGLDGVLIGLRTRELYRRRPQFAGSGPMGDWDHVTRMDRMGRKRIGFPSRPTAGSTASEGIGAVNHQAAIVLSTTIALRRCAVSKTSNASSRN